MTVTLHLVLYVVAAICFALAALAPLFGWNLGRFNAIAWGLLAWVMTAIV